MTARPLAVTLGDPAGIGPELTLRAFADRQALGLPSFVAIGSRATLEAHAAALGDRCDVFPCASPDDASRAPDNSLPLIATGNDAPVTPGVLTEDGAQTSIASIEAAVRLALDGAIAGIVTQPINKANMVQAGFAHPGHTEFLAALSARHGKATSQPVMMLAAGDFRVIPITVHIPLSAVPKALSTDLIVETGVTVAHVLRTDFGIAAPRLAVAGLNPHAGERGVLGTEDDAIIAPAIARLNDRGIATTGPHPADTLFHAAARATYDAALAMYHDQALIPIKTVAFDEAVNVTLGLPFVRTSPDHGTAIDIAGQGLARPDSFIAALRLADTMAQSRYG